MMITFIVFLFLAQALASCPDGSITVASDCYMVSQQKMTWFEAQEVRCAFLVFVKLRQGSSKDRQGIALKAKGLA